MQPRSGSFKIKSDNLLSVCLGIVGLAGLYATVYFGVRLVPAYHLAAWQFTWRPWAAFEALAVLTLLGITIVANRPKNRSRITLWFSMYELATAAAVFGIFIGTISRTYQTYDYWSFISTLGTAAVGPAFLFFVCAYIGAEDRLYRPLTLSLIFLPAVFIFGYEIMDQTTPYAFKFSPAFGFQVGASASGDPTYPVLIAWLFTFIILGTVLLIRQLLNTKNPKRRLQTKLILIANLIPFTLAGLPILIGPLQPYIPVTTCISNVLQASLLAYAMFYYGVFAVNSATIADTILSTMHEAVLTLNPNFTVERANLASVVLLGMTEGSIIGQKLEQVFGQEAGAKVIRKLGKAYGEALELQLKDQRQITVSLLSSTIMNSDNSIAGYVLVFRDVTKEHAAKAEIESQVIKRTEQVHEEQTKLRTSIESLGLGFAMVDNHNHVVMANQAVSAILGESTEEYWSLAELAGRLSHDFDLEAACDEVRHGKQRKYFEKVNSGNKILRLFLAPVAYREDATGLVIIMEDVTEEEVLKRSRDEFFSIASHELRTPLSAIRGNTSMILDYYKDILANDNSLKEMVTDVHESSIRLIDIVNDFLDVSRLEQGKISFDYKDVYIDKIIEAVIYEMRAVSQEKHLALKFSHQTLGVLPAVWADEDRLKQVIYNLVGNAAKFTQDGSISLDAEVQGAFLKVFVRDTGRGIAENNQKLLFRKFQQAGTSLLTRDTTRGTGLGLYISKMLIERMGGKIALEYSKENEGSVFSFTVPLANDEARHKAGTELNQPGFEGIPE